MNSLDEARKIFETFKAKEGSKNIAEVSTIKNIIDICVTDRPRRVLEMGSGIGTITHTVLTFSDAQIDSYESNEWCYNQLRLNVGSPARLNVIRTYRMLPPNTEYDLVIVDGGLGGGRCQDHNGSSVPQIHGQGRESRSGGNPGAAAHAYPQDPER